MLLQKSRMASMSKFICGAVAALAVAALVITDADARAGKGGSAGSRGANTQSAPPATNTAPKPAAPIEKSMTQPGKASPTAGAATAAGSAAQAAKPNMMRNLLLGGLMGAALGSIFGFGAMASVMGFILQSLLIGGALFLAFMLVRRLISGPKPALATASAGPQANAQQQQNSFRAAPGMGTAQPALNVAPVDFESFERLLTEVQTAYGRGDIKALETRTTPEMLSYFAQEIDQNAKQGIRNELSDVKLLQGDLAESWRESGAEYATVAMRYSILDVTVETASTRVVAGNRTRPEEVTEIWTFMRPVNGNPSQWELSAIPQAA